MLGKKNRQFAERSERRCGEIGHPSVPKGHVNPQRLAGRMDPLLQVSADAVDYLKLFFAIWQLEAGGLGFGVRNHHGIGRGKSGGESSSRPTFKKLVSQPYLAVL
jgi:hypothetical protein